MGANVTVKSYRKEREAEIMGGLEKAMVKVKALVQRQAIANVMPPKPSGKLHPNYKDTSRLASSIAEFSHMEKDANTITAVIGTNVNYGLFLELGITRKDNSVVHYPWLFPAVELKRKEIIETIKAAGGKNIDIEVVGGVYEKGD